MKQTVDATKSRRPVYEMEAGDVEQLTKLIDAQCLRVEELELDIEIREKDPEWAKIVAESKQRLMEIALKNIQIDVSDTLRHAEIVGQFNERLRLTRELLFAKKEVVTKRNWLAQLRRRLSELTERARQREKRNV